MNLEKLITGVPDFPKPGILFRDISPLLANAEAFHYARSEEHTSELQSH